MTVPQRPTPRTDEEEFGCCNVGNDCTGHAVLSDFARSLERSLSEREEECERLRGKLARLAVVREKIGDAAYEWGQYVTEDSAPRTLVDHMEAAFDSAVAALSAAEAGGARDRTTK